MPLLFGVVNRGQGTMDGNAVIKKWLSFVRIFIKYPHTGCLLLAMPTTLVNAFGLFPFNILAVEEAMERIMKAFA